MAKTSKYVPQQVAFCCSYSYSSSSSSQLITEIVAVTLDIVVIETSAPGVATGKLAPKTPSKMFTPEGASQLKMTLRSKIPHRCRAEVKGCQGIYAQLPKKYFLWSEGSETGKEMM